MTGVIQFGHSADTDQVNYQLIRLKDGWFWQGSYFTSTPTFLPMKSLGNCDWEGQITVNQANTGRFPSGPYLVKIYNGSDMIISNYQNFSL